MLCLQCLTLIILISLMVEDVHAIFNRFKKQKEENEDDIILCVHLGHNMNPELHPDGCWSECGHHCNPMVIAEEFLEDWTLQPSTESRKCKGKGSRVLCVPSHRPGQGAKRHVEQFQKYVVAAMTPTGQSHNPQVGPEMPPPSAPQEYGVLRQPLGATKVPHEAPPPGLRLPGAAQLPVAPLRTILFISIINGLLQT